MDDSDKNSFSVHRVCQSLCIYHQNLFHSRSSISNHSQFHFYFRYVYIHILLFSILCIDVRVRHFSSPRYGGFVSFLIWAVWLKNVVWCILMTTGISRCTIRQLIIAYTNYKHLRECQLTMARFGGISEYVEEAYVELSCGASIETSLPFLRCVEEWDCEAKLLKLRDVFFLMIWIFRGLFCQVCYDTRSRTPY